MSVPGIQDACLLCVFRQHCVSARRRYVAFTEVPPGDPGSRLGEITPANKHTFAGDAACVFLMDMPTAERSGPQALLNMFGHNRVSAWAVAHDRF